MSSIYRIFCLSHDPAILVEDLEWQSGADGCRTMEGVLNAVQSDDRLLAHRECDLLGSRHSGALIELYCPPAPTGPINHYPCHMAGQWIKVEWLQLLSAVYARNDIAATPTAAAASKVDGCWSRDRLWRLRFELDTDCWWTA